MQVYKLIHNNSLLKWNSLNNVFVTNTWRDGKLPWRDIANRSFDVISPLSDKEKKLNLLQFDLNWGKKLYGKGKVTSRHGV